MPEIDEELAIEKGLQILISPYHTYSQEEKKALELSNTFITQRGEVVRQLESKIGDLARNLTLTPKSDKNWQPSDFLPDFSKQEWHSELLRFQKESRSVSDAIFVILGANTITEEVLPTYSRDINVPKGAMDYTGTMETSIQSWNRLWTAEEAKHGTVLEAALLYSGRTNARKYENIKQYLAIAGFNPGVGLDPYKLYIFTSFQEAATQISHRNTAKLFEENGAETFYNISNQVSKDEARHKKFYKEVFKEILKSDPNGAMTSYWYMMKNKIKMPAQNMTDGYNNNMFSQFESVAKEQKMYTTSDYADIFKELNKDWNIENIEVTTNFAKIAKDELIKKASQIADIAERLDSRKIKFDVNNFPWVVPLKTNIYPVNRNLS